MEKYFGKAEHPQDSINEGEKEEPNIPSLVSMRVLKWGRRSLLIGIILVGLATCTVITLNTIFHFMSFRAINVFGVVMGALVGFLLLGWIFTKAYSEDFQNRYERGERALKDVAEQPSGETPDENGADTAPEPPATLHESPSERHAPDSTE
jgi:hypothetical protein